MSRRDTEHVDRPYQIVCEGADDRAFLQRLCRAEGLDEFQVGCPQGADGRCEGKDQFGKRIDAVRVGATVPLRGIVIVADCDDDPTDRFRNAQKHLRNKKLQAPQAPLSISEDKDGFRTAIVLVPFDGSHGGLETVLLQCCDQITAHVPCVDTFCQCVGAPAKQLDADKVRLRTLIVALRPDDPGLALSSWVTDTNRPFPLPHPALDPLVAFLRQVRG